MRRNRSGIGIWMWVLLLGAAPGTLAATLEKIDHAYHDDNRGEYYRFVFHLSSIPRYEVRQLDSGRKLALDLKDSRTDCSRRQSVTDSRSPVKQLSIEARSGGAQRILFELRDRVGRVKHFGLPKPNRLVLDFYPSGSKEKSVGAAASDRSPSEYASSSPPVRNFKVVVIDPGHGGWDNGAEGYGYQEKDIVLDVCRQLHQYFQRSNRFHSYLTRDRDELPFVGREKPDYSNKRQRDELRRKSLAGRVEFANREFEIGGAKYPAYLFLSVHVNSFVRNRRVSGFETWIPGDKIAQDEMSRELQALENGEPLLDAVYIEDSDSAKVLLSMVGERMQELNPILAHHIDREMRLIDPGLSSRGLKEGPFRVLRNLRMPAVLVEIGFLSNRSETKTYLSQSWFRRQVAYRLYTAVNRYFAEIEGFQPDLVVAPQARPRILIHRVVSGDCLEKIGAKYGVSYQRIKQYNQLTSDRIRAGQTLRIPL